MGAMAPELVRRAARKVDRRRIAVIPLRGVIGGAVRSSDVMRALSDARRSRRVRAVLLDIDSPGGSATSSEAIHLAVRRLAAEKPVVAWIRGTGASGAYFAACGATRILAFPSAVVGSIGVISARPLLVEALRRIGAGIVVTTTGPFKDMGAFWREPTDAERAKERALVDAIFSRFSGAVREARGFDDASLAKVTTGEIWIGVDALRLGLVDELCEDEDAALETVQRLADLPHKETVHMRPRRTVLQRLGVPGAGMGPPGPRWIAEIEGWLRAPRAML